MNARNTNARPYHAAVTILHKLLLRLAGGKVVYSYFDMPRRKVHVLFNYISLSSDSTTFILSVSGLPIIC